MTGDPSRWLIHTNAHALIHTRQVGRPSAGTRPTYAPDEYGYRHIVRSLDMNQERSCEHGTRAAGVVVRPGKFPCPALRLPPRPSATRSWDSARPAVNPVRASHGVVPVSPFGAQGSRQVTANIPKVAKKHGPKIKPRRWSNTYDASRHSNASLALATME